MDEDMILPEGFEDTPQAEETPQETDVNEMEPEDFTEPTEEDTTPSDEPAETTEPEVQEQEQPKLKLKFNHEEREISLEEATLLAQKGMVFDKAVERAKQEARDAYIAEQGYEWNGKPITSEAEYKQAMMEREIMEKYQGQVPDEIMQEIIESRRDREERQRERVEKEEQSKKDAQIQEFFEYFQAANDRAFDPNKDTIPQEVRDAFDKGTPLKYAYMEHHNRELRNRLKIAKKNEENTKKAPVGSVTAFGGTKTDPVDDFLAGFDSI